MSAADDARRHAAMTRSWAESYFKGKSGLAGHVFIRLNEDAAVIERLLAELGEAQARNERLIELLTTIAGEGLTREEFRAKYLAALPSTEEGEQ